MASARCSASPPPQTRMPSMHGPHNRGTDVGLSPAQRLCDGAPSRDDHAPWQTGVRRPATGQAPATARASSLLTGRGGVALRPGWLNRALPRLPKHNPTGFVGAGADLCNGRPECASPLCQACCTAAAIGGAWARPSPVPPPGSATRNSLSFEGERTGKVEFVHASSETRRPLTGLDAGCVGRGSLST